MNGHHQRRGERWPATHQAFMSDVALLRIARRVDAIVLQVDWLRYSEQFFVRPDDEVDSMFRELLKQQQRSLQASFAVGVRQLLCPSLL